MTNRNAEREAEVTAQKQGGIRRYPGRPRPTVLWTVGEIRDALGWDKPRPGTVPTLLGYWAWPTAGLMMRMKKWCTCLEEDGQADHEFDISAPVAGLLTSRISWRSRKAYYAALDAASQKSWDDAQAAKDEFDRNRSRRNWPHLSRNRTPTAGQRADGTGRALRQPRRCPRRGNSTTDSRSRRTRTNRAPSLLTRRASIIADLRTYIGPLTKNRLPTRKGLNDHSNLKIKGWEKRECWPEAQND